MRTISCILGVGVAIWVCSTAQARVVSINCNFPDDLFGYYHNWDYDFVNDELTLTERLFGMPSSEGDRVVMSGETDAVTTFTVTKTITNTTGMTWTGYDLELLGNGTFVVDTAGSTKLGTYSFSDDYKILHFYAPRSVHNNELVTLQVDISIPTTGLFNFTMAQHPIPEPSTLLLLVLGAAIARRKQ